VVGLGGVGVGWVGVVDVVGWGWGGFPPLMYFSHSLFFHCGRG